MAQASSKSRAKETGKDSKKAARPLSADLLDKMHAYWRAANYLSVGQIYLLDNPLLKKPLKREHVKPRLLGHWGTTPGLNFIYVHLNRAIRERQQPMIYITGPGHGGPGLVANSYLEGTYTETYPNIDHSDDGIQKLFKQFSFPGGIPSHVAPETPGSMHEGGELGYSLSHAYGAAFDNPDQVVVAVVGDGEAETGPLATSWHSNKFLNPARDGSVLPILHLNGYKIANPTVLSRLPKDELTKLFEGYGHTVHYVEVGDDVDDYASVHQAFAATLDTVLDEIAAIRAQAAKEAKAGKPITRPHWPMIILRSPKGWTGPKEIDGKKVEGYWRSHQVPFSDMTPEHVDALEKWLKSYKPKDLFNDDGSFKAELAALAPEGALRMSANPHVHGLVSRDLKMPDFRKYEVKLDKPGRTVAEATRVMGKLLRDVMKENEAAQNFRIFGPDETASNRWADVFDESGKTWLAEHLPEDAKNDHLADDGRVMEILSEHTCQGWLEGYNLTGRHGFFSCYEAFIHVIDSMFNQHAKWLKTTKDIAWRRRIPSLNYLLTSHVWRQDHNGFSHQDPGFLDHVVNKKAEVIRVYLPPDANTLLSVTDHCLRSRHYVNVVVAGKQPALQYLTMEQAIKHCTKGLGIWDWASNDEDGEPDVVMGCAGDVPTMEALAATDLLRQHFPDLKVRFVNVVDLMTLQSKSEHPHGLDDHEFDAIFTTDKPIVFAFHGYPWLIHRLTYRRNGHDNLHVRGYIENGTTSTPFDMVVMNQVDRYNLAIDVIDRVPRLQKIGAHVRQKFCDKLIEHKHYINEVGDDLPEVKNWVWPY
ncbi:xylulose-5-phosphate/fructose-6-phosphate phosphoketolase [Andreprevotia lacus DSM 23236]|jgi:xylulose-5-phosphate/fructose-6-phosphate phosphoketolase|uniref:Probable phosphoketolase n=1 Tax=Andreprevotia lacus DSM 23236 TaxID=1121001 RepID=A0A1W1Y1U8_9NEIS|nr:phosphoketolase family protein [Andreprevotia lacus]SMC29738.1 xylulose-5-phosphate/fructose-6-phosphate phosphoketolase [Andreprevotia lacus DSM 23236]